MLIWSMFRLSHVKVIKRGFFITEAQDALLFSDENNFLLDASGEQLNIPLINNIAYNISLDLEHLKYNAAFVVDNGYNKPYQLLEFNRDLMKQYAREYKNLSILFWPNEKKYEFINSYINKKVPRKYFRKGGLYEIDHHDTSVYHYIAEMIKGYYVMAARDQT